METRARDDRFTLFVFLESCDYYCFVAFIKGAVQSKKKIKRSYLFDWVAALLTSSFGFTSDLKYLMANKSLPKSQQKTTFSSVIMLKKQA